MSNEIMKNVVAKEDLASPKMLSPQLVSSPLRSSSPTIGMTGAGDGDGHSLRSVHSLLSPIRSSRASHKMNCATLESPPETCHVHLDSFLTNFEKNLLSTKKGTTIIQMQDDLILDDSIEEMDVEDVKKQLIKALIENKGLREELRTKERRITAYKGQMLAILDWKVREEDKENGVEGASDTRNKGDKTSQEKVEVLSPPHNMTLQKSIHNVQEVTVVNQEVFSVRRSLSFIQEIASSIDVDQELLRHRIRDGCNLTNQLLVGGLAGWTTALCVKKFGKIALSAVGGGVLLLVYTARKGYVNVNYDSIYQEISHLCDTDNNGSSSLGCDRLERTKTSDSNLNSEEDQQDDEDEPDESMAQNWAVRDKLRNAKKWVTSHSYTVGGFCLGFVYNLV